MSLAMPVTPVAVTVRLTITHTAEWGVYARHIDYTFTDSVAVVAFARAYRYARFLMGGRSAERPAWTAYHTGYGWSLETMDAHNYRVRVITSGEQWDEPAGHAMSTLSAPPVAAGGISAPDSSTDPEWLVTVPLTQTVPAATPAAAIALACQCVEDSTTLWWPAINDHAAYPAGVTVNPF